MSVSRQRGQALVEFAIAFSVFALMVMAVIDFGRAIYTYNAVSQGAREIARTTSVHPGATLGASPETVGTVGAQRALIPNMTDPTFACVDIDGSTVAGSCVSGDSVKVTLGATYQPITPLLSMIGAVNLVASSSVEIQ